MLKRLLAAAAALVGVGLATQAVAGPLDYAVIITNKEYAKHSYTHDVKYAHEDGKAFKKALLEVFKIPENRITEIRDATLARFNDHFGNPKARDGLLFDELKHPKGRLFVFYSGHGVPGFTRSDPNTPKPYLLPVDSNPQRVAATGYALDDLVARLREIKTERLFEGEVILVLEACFSGVSHAGAILDRTSGSSFNPTLPAATGGSNDIVILSATRSDEVASWDEKASLGVFTNALVDGIYGLADQDFWKGNADRKLSLAELRRFTESRMSERLRQLYKGARRQSPTFTGADGLVLAEYDPGRYPVRDPRVMAEEETQCRILKAARESSRIKSFLDDCVYCLCRAELEKKVAELDRDLQFCDSERETAGRLFGEGNLAELEVLVGGARCVSIKAEFAAKVDDLKRTCADERKVFEEMRTKRQLDRMKARVNNIICASVKADTRRYVDRQLEACERAAKQFNEVKAAGDPETLQAFARRVDCDEIKSDALKIAEELIRICANDLQILHRFKVNKLIPPISTLANNSRCGAARDDAKRFLDALEVRCSTDAAAWGQLKDSKDLAALRKVLAATDCPRIKLEIERRIVAVEEGDRPPIVAGKPAPECKDCPEVVMVRPGCFRLGGDPTHEDTITNEKPQVVVRIERAFAIGTREVTVGEWAACHAAGGCPTSAPAGANPRLPIGNVSYNDIQAYLKWLSTASRRSYRLPSEAEWEYAARAGTTTIYAFGDRLETSQARFRLGLNPSTPAPVGTFPPNAFGLYDMHGNAAEIVADCYADQHTGLPPTGAARTGCREAKYVLRGGSWQMLKRQLRSSWRDSILATFKREDIGFRVARDILPTEGDTPAPTACPR